MEFNSAFKVLITPLLKITINMTPMHAVITQYERRS